MILDLPNQHIHRCLSTLNSIRYSSSLDIQDPSSLLNSRNKALRCMDRWILNCPNFKHSQIQLSHQLSRKIRKNMEMKIKNRKCTNKIRNPLMKFHRLKAWKKSVKRIWKYQHKSQAKRITSQVQNKIQSKIHLLLERKAPKNLDPILKTRIRIHHRGKKEIFLTKTIEYNCLKER